MADNSLPDNANTQPADLTTSGSPVNQRVGTADKAQAICARFIRDDMVRAQRRLLVQGKFNGNAPNSRAAMLKAKRGGDSNLNWKQHKGHIINAWTPFFDAVCEVPTCIDGTLDIGDPAQDADLMRGIAELFHDMVFGWDGFDDMNQLCDLQMLLHGVGTLAWEDEWKWYPKPVLANSVYLPDESLLSMGNCEIVMITRNYTAGELYRCIIDGKEAKASGWYASAVKDTIMLSAEAAQTQQFGKLWDRWEQAFKNGDLYMTQTQTKQIPLATLFVQEMDGTISQMIVQQSQSSGTTSPGAAGVAQFLFYAQSKFDSWEQVVCMFPYDIGADGTYHSVKGLGTDIFPYCELMDKINNTIADTIILGIKPLWQPTTGGDIEKFQMVKWGGGNLVPNGFTNIDLQPGRNLQPALEVSREFSTYLSQNTGAYTPQDVAAPTVDETAKAASIRAAERGKLNKGAFNRYMRSKDRQYSEMFRRASNPKLRAYHPGSELALKFQRDCKRLCFKMGVPWEVTFPEQQKDFSPTGKAGKFTVLQMVQNVRANRSIGMGSAAMRFDIAQQLMANIDRYDEVGQNEVLRAFTAVLMGYHQVDAFVPSLANARNNNNDESVAAGEDNSFSLLGPNAEAFVVPGQNHVIHLQIHIPSMQKDMQDCQSGQVQPQECFTRLEGKAPHAQQHLKILKSNPTRQQEYQQFSKAFAEIASFQDHLQQMLEEAQQNQPPPPQQPDPEMVKVQENARIKEQKEQANTQLKAQKQQQDQALKAQQVHVTNTLADFQTAAKIKRDNALATAKARNMKPASNGKA